MIVTYSPKGEESRRWEWSPDQVKVSEAEVIEKRFGGTWDEYRIAVLQGSMKARRVLLWHLQKRDHPTLKCEDVDFAVGDLKVEMTRVELEEFREAVVKAKGIDDDQRSQALSALDAEIETAPDGDGPKAS